MAHAPRGGSLPFDPGDLIRKRAGFIEVLGTVERHRVRVAGEAVLAVIAPFEADPATGSAIRFKARRLLRPGQEEGGDGDRCCQRAEAERGAPPTQRSAPASMLSD